MIDKIMCYVDSGVAYDHTAVWPVNANKAGLVDSHLFILQFGPVFSKSFQIMQFLPDYYKKYTIALYFTALNSC